MNKSLASIAVLLCTIVLFDCSCIKKAHDDDQAAFLLAFLALPHQPVLGILSITGTDSSSITLSKPVLSVAGNPSPDILAYIGREDTISISGSSISGSTEGPVDVSSTGYQFNGLTDRTRYKIIVIASNPQGNSVKEITQLTRGTGLWTWVSGDDTANQSGVYGTKGVAADANKPGSRWQFVSWADSSDNLWLFGGVGYDASGNFNYLNDLWMFDGTRWTWISGDNTIDQSGVYGTKGIAADANKPGARYRSVSWIDSLGNLWLFGGNFSGMTMNDLWKFDGARWTWVSGDNTFNPGGVYGTKGVAAGANKPGGHDGSVCWIDSSDNLWIFGGWTSRFNDLWKFDSAMWTWVSGDNTTDQPGIYGAKGVAADANKPGARGCSISWIDASDNLWLFGGHGTDSTTSTGYLNDLWKFDGTRWTWVSGDNTINPGGLYGTKGIAADANKPGGRWGLVSWTDTSGNLWLLGGVSQDVSSNYIFFNDLWKFDGTRWTWVSGDNTPDQSGVYGTKGVAAASNKPGARAHSVSWIDSCGNFWLCGGVCWGPSSSTVYLNDLWKYSPE